MNRIQRKKTKAAVLGAVLGAFAVLAPLPSAPCQTPPAYPQLFQDPPRTDQLTQADLPNLGRLVVLEATSMFVHARTELADSPASYRLLEQITTLWNAADAFTAAVSYYPLESQGIEAGRLTFPDLEAAFDQVRATLGTLPGIAPQSAVNLVNMSRAVAVIGPLLRQNPPGLAEAAATDQRAQEAALLTNQARELSSAIATLENQLTAGGRKATSDRLDREIDVLAQLAQGFERIVDGQADERDLISSFRPIRSRAQRIDRELQLGGLADAGRNLWRSIEQQIDGLAARFQLPREIVPHPAREDSPSLDPTIAAPIDQALREIDTLVNPSPAGATRPPQRGLIQADARRLQTRLYLLRQYLLGQGPQTQTTQALGDLEMAWRQLNDRISRPGQGDLDPMRKLSQSLDETIARTRDQLSKTR
jgi:hypothetical protein